ncbi:hypothetical protein H5410_035167 [Solanum commersonii]|uniref:Uncharacterized protein n=1 Tax=Solanum commersonii TaxID=4109 RepID=A0A9J5Y244_SOLCO|nr:hypothetical protein H5410_035167 [Solanum commersonii]
MPRFHILEKLEALVEIRIQEWHFLYKAIDDSWWTWLLTCSNFQVAEFGPTMTNPGSVSSSNDDTSRVKFLCSFSGSILPRPQDGKLRMWVVRQE